MLKKIYIVVKLTKERSSDVFYCESIDIAKSYIKLLNKTKSYNFDFEKNIPINDDFAFFRMDVRDLSDIDSFKEDFKNLTGKNYSFENMKNL